jgi:hypothetical protein
MKSKFNCCSSTTGYCRKPPKSIQFAGWEGRLAPAGIECHSIWAGASRPSRPAIQWDLNGVLLALDGNLIGALKRRAKFVGTLRVEDLIRVSYNLSNSCQLSEFQYFN